MSVISDELQFLHVSLQKGVELGSKMAVSRLEYISDGAEVYGGCKKQMLLALNQVMWGRLVYAVG